MELTEGGRRVLEARYLQRDADGKVCETPEQMVQRVAHAIARNMDDYQRFVDVMERLDFLPNSPTLMNAGTELGQLAACFVIPIEDDMGAIMDSLKYAALIQKSGGGVGFSFSRLRPEGDKVRTTNSVAGGPIPFIELYDSAAQCVKQGGKRFGANMGVMRVDHPDIAKFILLKQREGHLRWFNLSVAVTDEFMMAAGAGGHVPFINPRTKEEDGGIPAATILDAIVEQAWQNGEPGVLFIDTINKKHRVKGRGDIEATNPCGEQPLLPYESCNLGSINLAHMVMEDGENMNWDHLGNTVRIAIRFLDSVIDRNRYPIEQIQRKTLYTRKIGLGVMGFHDALAFLGIPYHSEQALDMAQQIASFIATIAGQVSEQLAEEFGPYPYWTKADGVRRRNATLLTVAPTGSISTIAGASNGIEPWYALRYERLAVGATGAVYEPVACGLLMDWGVWEQVEDEVEKFGQVYGNSHLTEEQSELMKTALNIPAEHHIRMQSVWQQWVDNAVSKTVNIPEETTPEQIRKYITMAWTLGCKGITIYRDGSRKTQAHTTRGGTKRCPSCGEGLVYTGGKCLECPEHGPVECGV